MGLLPLDALGAVEHDGAVTFGLWLPWVSAAHGNVVTIKIIHAADQLLQDVPPREFTLAHSLREPHGTSGLRPFLLPAPCRPYQVRPGEGRDAMSIATRSHIRTSARSTGSSTPSRVSSASISCQRSRSGTSRIAGATRKQTGAHRDSRISSYMRSTLPSSALISTARAMCSLISKTSASTESR